MKDSLIGIMIRYGIGLTLIASLIYVLFAFSGCASTKHMEQVNVRDSVVYNYRDSIIWHHRDSVNIVTHHVAVRDSSGTFIQFGQGGGTYNAKTGEATNVAGVRRTDTHHEKHDSTAYYRNLCEAAKKTCYELQADASEYKSELTKERQRPKRTGYDMFCSWWFWITAILLLIKVAAWSMEKFPATAPYIYTIRKFIPFL